MKARFLALAALVLGLASCQTEPEGLDVNVGGAVDTTITVSLPEATRANSAFGAFENVVNTDEYTIRYILQVFYKGYESGADRHVIYSDGKTVKFPVRLVPGRAYSFVAWADVVLQDGKTLDELTYVEDTTLSDLHYNTAELTNITLRDWNAMDETRDAFTDVETLEYYGNSTISLQLIRPFAKLRVKTIDMAALNDLGIEPTTATVAYTTDLYSAFNALEGNVTGDTTTKTHTSFSITAYDDNENDKSMVLFTDYLFAKDEAEPVNFTLTVYDQHGTELENVIKVNNFNTAIPAQRNYLTTISGNILTDGNNIKVEVESDFENKDYSTDAPYYVEIWDGKTIKAPAQDEADNYVIERGSELAWLAAAVNGTLPEDQTTRAAIDNFAGKTFVLTQDIDLGGNEWTPISMSTNLAGGETFRGTFDGQGHTIKGLYVRQQEVAGLFGYVYAATIKNVTIEGANLYSNHYAGGVVAWVLNTKGNIKVPFVMENCHVKNSTIVSTPALINGEWDNGDKVGGLVGYADINNEGAEIKDCSVKNTSIKAYRDFGGLIGYAKGVAINNYTVENISLEQDLSHNYKAPNTPNTFGMIIGRNEGGNTINGADYSYEAVTNGVFKVNDNYYIYNADGLKWLADEINAIDPYEASVYDDATFKLANDIDLNRAEWTPIGDWASQRTEFHGTFDGQGYTISNFVITKPCERGEKQADSAYGLFGNVKGGTIKNVTVSNVTVSGVAKFAAALVGRLDGNIENCHVKNASITCSSWQVGGLVAQYNNGTISGCSVEDTTVSSGIGGVGAIVGYALTNVERTIENCSVKNCNLIQTEPYSAGYDDMFATILGGVHVSGTTININGCTAENNTIKGVKSDNIVGYIEPGAKVYIDGNLYACAETTEQLEAALKAGGHVALVNNVTMTKALALSNANFTLDGNGYTITMAEDATNTYALFDITGGKAAIKNVTFDGIKGGAIVRTVGVEFTAENVTAKNGNHTQQQGLFRLMGKSTIKNCTFENNTCNLVITLNYDGANNDPQVVENCVFEGNTCNKTAVLYYVKGAGATINGNKFVNNTVNVSNGATLYMGFTENNVITNNLFEGNIVTATSVRSSGGLMIGYDAVITGNAFVNNTLTVNGETGYGNDVCASVYYTAIDLSGNYWGGNAPVAGVNYYKEFNNYEVIINDYLTANPFN